VPERATYCTQQLTRGSTDTVQLTSSSKAAPERATYSTQQLTRGSTDTAAHELQ